ncbi:divalent metal cation transporter, partial [Enterococcus sp. S133_ASV_20]
IMSTLFAVALLASGQNSTITGTLAGQIVMEGFLRLHIPNWLRRLITRSLAVIPVIVCLIIFKGNAAKIEQLLVFSQVFLSIALPFCLI